MRVGVCVWIEVCIHSRELAPDDLFVFSFLFLFFHAKITTTTTGYVQYDCVAYVRACVPQLGICVNDCFTRNKTNDGLNV